MAYAINQYGCNRNMHAGMTDGTYKKAAPNRGGVVEPTFAAVRREMCGIWHGFNEIQEKVLPDGRTDNPPYYFNVAPIHRSINA